MAPAAIAVALAMAPAAAGPVSPLLVQGETRPACAPFVADNGVLMQRANWPILVDGVASGSVGIVYRGHSTFVIETPGGATVATDYNGIIVPTRSPDVVTMNNAHSTHYTEYVDVAVRHVLRGWDPAGGIARHDVTFKDLRVFNVPTNLATVGGGLRNGNSIFVFHAAGLCLAHLGHLHHLLSDEMAKAMGRIDVLFVPIDGSMTLSIDETLTIIATVSPRLVIPMHYHFPGVSERFSDRAGRLYPIALHDRPLLIVSRASLPTATRILFLPPG